MVSDAEAHRSEDAALRAQVDARNELDTVAYQVRRTLEDNAAAIPEHERARADLLLNDARNALEGQANVERLRALTGEMHQLLQSLAASARLAPRQGRPLVRRKARRGVGRRFRRRDRRRVHRALIRHVRATDSRAQRR